MKSAKHLLLIIPLLFLLLTGTSFAHDTDLYMASGQGVEPNILIIFDTSGSMGDEVQAYTYNNATTYDPLVVSTTYRNRVYYKTSTGWSTFKNDISLVSCASAVTALTSKGWYEGYTNSTCNLTWRSLRTGNYRNYLASINYDEYRAKIDITKQVLKDFLDVVSGVRVGIMKFNYDEGGYLHSEMRSLNDTTRSQLKTEVDNVWASGWTPIAETLYETGLYFKGGSSYFNSGVTYTSPIQYSCQKNYVIIITDGISTHDRNSVLRDGATVGSTVYPKIGDQDGDQREPGMVNNPGYDDSGSDYLDDVAKYLFDTDLRTDLTGLQNIVTYTIGFELDSSDPVMAPKAKDLLSRAATLGHGKFYTTIGTTGLADAFQNIIGEILAKSTSFVAPIVPVSRLERTTAGDKIYLALFKPTASGMWYGNIKKFGVAQSDNPSMGIKTGDILDVNGAKALDSKGQFFATAKSYWTTSSDSDGGEVVKGGVGHELINRATARNIYTYFKSHVNLTDSSNAFTLGNASITPTVLGLLLGDTVGRDKLINFVHGYDAYDDNNNDDTTEKRDWILGSFLHSRPIIIHYPDPNNPNLPPRSVIFSGGNDGMLHAFNDSDGRELWGFIPPDLLNKLHALHADVMETYVDGSPRAYLHYGSDGAVDQAILIFGERRGGNLYYALDVTNPDVPKFLWSISPTARVYQTTTNNTTDFQEMGQTWSSPVIGKIGLTAGDKWVAFIGGGYDPNQDNAGAGNDIMGRAVYVVDVFTGALVKRFSNAEVAGITQSIPSDVAKVDTDGNGKIDRLYVGTTGGRVWRFDIADPNPTNWTAKNVFKANPGGTEKRKMFYPPDVALERDAIGSYEMLFFGTGDREDPKEKTIVNRLYGFKDRNLASFVADSDLENVTSSFTASDALKNYGWYITLENQSEKCLATPVLFYKSVYYTTFTASTEVITGQDPCYVGEGTARLYVVKYDTGNAVFNFDLTNDVNGTEVRAKSDRSIYIGTAIPSGVIITFIGGTAVAYTGVGGGVYAPELTSTNPLVPMTWRVLF